MAEFALAVSAYGSPWPFASWLFAVLPISGISQKYEFGGGRAW